MPTMTTLQIIYTLIGLAVILWTPRIVTHLYARYTTRRKLKALEKFFKQDR